MAVSGSPRPEHIESVVRSIADIHARHGESATRGQKALNRAAAWVGRPLFLAAVVLTIVVWIGANLALAAWGPGVLDRPPFAWLQGAMGLLSLCLVILLVGAQRHEDQMIRNRDLLELEIAIVSEQKMAKVIQLLEELRRDMPHVHDRVDEQAEAMSQTSDHGRVLDTLAESADRAEEQ
jgi:uncharacterized membrane protein